MAGTLRIRKQSITEMDVDCIVNAANSQLRHGGGVCGAIFAAAGARELQAACDALGHCPTGEAAITPGFNLKAKYIVHAVGPIWQGGSHNEETLLYSCYQNAMKVACAKGCHSIAFPLISSGIYGYPVKDAWRVAIKDDFAVSFPHDSLLLKALPALGLQNNCLTLLINQEISI